MIELHITPAFIVAITSIIGISITLIGWIIRLERRFHEVLTKEEHKEICHDRHEDVMEQIEEIKAMFRDFKQEVKAANDYSSTQRHQMRQVLQSMEVKLAQLSRAP